MIEEVCDIVGHHHHPREDDNINFKSLHDADLIVNLEDKQKEGDFESEKLEGILKKSFLTKSGGELAREVLIN
ncbi:hypothetical protein ACFL1Z_09440 [Thermodesulfobacteriota bacterium]